MLRGGFSAEVTFTEIRREGGSKPHRHLGRPSQKEEQRGQRRRPGACLGTFEQEREAPCTEGGSAREKIAEQGPDRPPPRQTPEMPQEGRWVLF